MLKKKLKKLVNIFQWLLTAVLVLVVLLLIFTAFNPVKAFQVFRVMSGSMEPKIKVGSVVFVQRVNPEILKESDIITYTSLENSDISVTHRLIAIEEKEGQTVFKTRGDANNSDDITETLPGQIKGKVVFSLPFLGYLSVWIRKPWGFGLLVILPAILIIISEILNIKKAIEKEVEKKYTEQGKHPKNKPINLLLIFLLGIGLFQIKPTNAYFSDVIVVGGNTFSMADSWPSPPPTPPVAGSVVINELMWMGSVGNSNDEWIELRNTTGNLIDLSNWQITKWVAGTDEELMLTIPSGRTIPANDYFLISKLTKDASAVNVEPDLVDTHVVLRNSDLQIKLYKGIWTNSSNLIDTADDGSGTPLAGVDGANRQSMERNDTPGDGTTSASWHTCINDACNDTAYWDTEGNNYGTPKAANLSENDSTSPDYVVPTVTSTPTPTVTPELSSESSVTSSVTAEFTLTPSSTPSPTPEASPTPILTVEPTPTPSLAPETNPTPTPTIEPSPTPELNPTAEPTPVPSTTPTPEPSNTPNPTPTPAAEPPVAESPADEPPKESQVEEPPQNQTPLPEEGSEINE